MAQTLGSVAVGSIVKLNENGSPVEFYVAKHDYESGLNGAGRTLVVRKDCPANRQWANTNANAYADGSLDVWENGDYKETLDSDIQTAMGTTKFYYTPGNGNGSVSTLERSVFTLSLTELGRSYGYVNTEGTALPIASTLQVARRNGAACSQWSWSARSCGTIGVMILNTSGNYDTAAPTNQNGPRPVFTLPATMWVGENGTITTTFPAPATLTVPIQAMQGNQLSVSWSAVDGADGYILERKANTDADWTQVYSGANTSFEETVGTWTSVQYRVKAGVSGTYGDYTTSASVSVVSASAVVISGTDGDLGTLVNDVSYTVSSDGSTELTVVETINGTETRTYTATNGATNKIPVVDLPTGYGTISITASTNPGSGVVSVTREWTYTKAAITFPDAGSVADLTQQGKTIWAKTIAEAVRTPGIWGGNLGLALQKLMGAVLYNPTQVAKYSEVTVNLANVSVGQEVNLPYNGAMMPHIVVHIGNPNPSLYDASCDGVWLWRKGVTGTGVWNSTRNNNLPNSTIMTTMAGYVANYASDVQAAIKTVKIPYGVGNSTTVNSGANGLECKLFPLGAYEVGITTSDQPFIPVDGAKLDYFLSGLTTEANALRAGEARWLRSPTTSENSTTAWLINANGSVGTNYPDVSYGLEPAFIMPTTFTVSYYVGTDGSVHDEQEYEEAGTFTDISGGNIPMVSIETGSYVGTGTYGESNPNTLTFPFTPVLVFVGADTPNANRIAAILIKSVNKNLWITTSMTRSFASTTWEQNTVSWYVTNSSAGDQLNVSGTTYYYVAIGFAGGDTE